MTIHNAGRAAAQAIAKGASTAKGKITSAVATKTLPKSGVVEFTFIWLTFCRKTECPARVRLSTVSVFNASLIELAM
jgi:hypothetical protein